MDYELGPKNSLFHIATSDFPQQPSERFQPRCGHVTELELMKVPYRLVESFQEREALRCYVRFDYAPVLCLTLASDQTALFHAVEKARNIRIMANHAIADGAARQTFRRCAAQDTKNIVLCGCKT